MTMSINEICQVLQPVYELHGIGIGNAGYQQCLARLIKAANKQVLDMKASELMDLDRDAHRHYQIEADTQRINDAFSSASKAMDILILDTES